MEGEGTEQPNRSSSAKAKGEEDSRNDEFREDARRINLNPFRKEMENGSTTSETEMFARDVVLTRP